MVGEIVFKNPIWFSKSSNLFYYFTTLVITRTCTWEIIEQQVINLGWSHNFTNVGHKISAANNRKEDWDLQEYLLAGIIWGLSASRIEH